MTHDYRHALEAAVTAAREAGRILRADLHRPDGPRGGGHKADADEEAERAIRARLQGSFPAFGYLGEETGRQASARDEPHLWLVDPNDGTASYLKGLRGSAVSIGLLHDGRPVLGVVFAFAAPDDGGDLVAWAEGCGPLTRNGRPVERSPWPASLTADDVVLVSEGAQWKPEVNAAAVAPGRFRAMPSIAYRLALAAAGEGAVAVSLNGPGAWDYAGGHALLLGTGGVLVDESGGPVCYTREGDSGTVLCFGGSPAVAAELAARRWQHVLAAPKPAAEPYDLVRLQRGGAVEDAGVLSRAQGCLLGQLAGDALGALVEFERPETIRTRYRDGPSLMADGGTWHTLAGQPTDDSEMALALGRSIVACGGFDSEAAAAAYAAWYRSRPFDLGTTTGAALSAISDEALRHGQAAAAARAAASRSSQANGSLMRVSPLAIWGHRIAAADLAAHTRADASLTHPHGVCVESAATFVLAVAYAIRTGTGAEGVYRVALEWAERDGGEPAVAQVMSEAARRSPGDYLSKAGWVLVALQNAFHQLLHAPSLEAGIVRTVREGGDTDTNAAIAGALLGAVRGRDAVPLQWRQMILSCRPIGRLPGVHRPRPRSCWPVDALDLAERLLLAG